MRKCLTYAGCPCVCIDDDWDDNGKEALLFKVRPKFFRVIHDAVIHGYKKKGKQVDWIHKAISMIQAVSKSESWICTIWNLCHSLHYEFDEVQTFVIISTDELKKFGLIVTKCTNHMKVVTVAVNLTSYMANKSKTCECKFCLKNYQDSFFLISMVTLTISLIGYVLRKF